MAVLQHVPMGSLNRRNRDLLLYAVEQGRQVYTLRGRGDEMDFYAEPHENLIYCEGCQSMLGEIARHGF